LSTVEPDGFEPVKCFACQRPNSPAAIRCLWCAVLLNEDPAAGNGNRLQMELSYLGGLDRLDSPMPVSLLVTAEGVEIRELMPGSRIVKIPAASIIEARVVNNVDKIRVAGKISWWRKLIFDEETNKKKVRTKEEIVREYVVTIRYRSEDKTFNIAFRRDDATAAATAEKVAEAVNSLLKVKTAEAP